MVISASAGEFSGATQGVSYIYQLKTAADDATKSFKNMKEAAPYGSLGNFGQADYPEPPDYRSTAMGLSRMLFSVQMSTFYFGMLTNSMMQNQNATMQIENAQIRYNKAVREHGRNSEEAKIALNSLQMAQNTYQQSAKQSQMMTISMGINFVQMGLSALATVPSLTTLKITVDSLKTSIQGLWASIPGVGWAILGLSALTAGATAYTALSQPSLPSSNVNVNVQSDDAIIQQWIRRQTKTQIDTAG